MNKKQLLDTSLFYDNEYLDQYVALVNSHIHDAYEKGKTNKHHIIPKQVYKVLKLPVDNSHGNIVNLLAKEHLVAHCLLTLCSANSEIRRGMFASVLFLSNHKISCMQDIIALLNFNELDLYQKAYELGREEVKQHNPMYDADIKEKHDATMRLESTREKISKSMQIKIERGEFFSAEHRANLSKAQRNTCYIHRGNLTKRITKDELADWQARGWKKGNGQRLSEQHKESLRKSFGMVLQDTWIFSGTVKENITYGKKDASEEEIIEASKKANCYDFIMRLPNGFDTYIDDYSGLSVGQKQLISIARVMLVNPKIMILDEATSNIDTRTEMKISAAFNLLMKGKTSFVIAHRLSTIIHSDLIVVMKDGVIIEKGKHDELLANKGFYYELYNAQYSKIN